MAYEIDAIFSNGAFVPVTPVEIAEGVRVHLLVDESNIKNASPELNNRAELDEFLRLARELPTEGPDDEFSGVDHDKALYGEP